MVRVQPVDSLDLPELAPYRTMRRPLEHREQGIFVAEGEKVVRRLLESKLTVVSLLLPEKWFHQMEPLIRSRKEDFPVYLADKALLEKLIEVAPAPRLDPRTACRVTLDVDRASRSTPDAPQAQTRRAARERERAAAAIARTAAEARAAARTTVIAGSPPIYSSRRALRANAFSARYASA